MIKGLIILVKALVTIWILLPILMLSFIICAIMTDEEYLIFAHKYFERVWEEYLNI